MNVVIIKQTQWLLRKSNYLVAVFCWKLEKVVKNNVNNYGPMTLDTVKGCKGEQVAKLPKSNHLTWGDFHSHRNFEIRLYFGGGSGELS